SVKMRAVGVGFEVGIDGINRARQRGEVVAFTSHYGRLPAPSGKRVLIDADGRVAPWPLGMQTVSERAVMLEFDDDFEPLASIAAGERLRFDFELEPPVPGGVRFALGAGPQIVRGGKVAISGAEERFQSDVLLGRAPRTAV